MPPITPRRSWRSTRVQGAAGCAQVCAVVAPYGRWSRRLARIELDKAGAGVDLSTSASPSQAGVQLTPEDTGALRPGKRPDAFQGWRSSAAAKRFAAITSCRSSARWRQLARLARPPGTHRGVGLRPNQQLGFDRQAPRPSLSWLVDAFAGLISPSLLTLAVGAAPVPDGCQGDHRRGSCAQRR